MTDKYIKDGQVAILYSPGFGAGWSTWGAHELAYDRELVEAFLSGGSDALIEATERKYPDTYTGGARDVQVAWVEQGASFRINEYDGSESIERLGPQSFMTA